MRRSRSRPPVRSSLQRVRGSCDCPECRPAGLWAWLEGTPGPWFTGLVCGAILAAALGCYLL